MTIRLFGITVHISFWFFAVVLLLVVLEKAALAFYLLLPVAVHELGHLLVMLLLGVRIHAISFTPVSIDMQKTGTEHLSYRGEIAIHLAGAAANGVFAAILYFFFFQSMRVQLLIAVNVAVALFNLLPITGLDGGQVLLLFTQRRFGPAPAFRISRMFSLLLLVPLFGVSFFLIFRQTSNVSLLLTCIYLAITVAVQN